MIIFLRKCRKGSKEHDGPDIQGWGSILYLIKSNINFKNYSVLNIKIMKRPWKDPVDYPPPLERLELETRPPPENFNQKNYKSKSEETFDNDLPTYDELVEAKAFGDATAPSYSADEEFWKDF